jgi:hypothetical protein
MQAINPGTLLFRSFDSPSAMSTKSCLKSSGMTPARPDCLLLLLLLALLRLGTGVAAAREGPPAIAAAAAPAATAAAADDDGSVLSGSGKLQIKGRVLLPGFSLTGKLRALQAHQTQKNTLWFSCST